MKYFYNKLVRDKVIDNIKGKGHKCEYRKLEKEEYHKELDKKLIEEANEVIESHTAEEIGDLMQVVKTMMREYNISYEEVKSEMEQKEIKNGAFDEMLFLISVEENDKERE